jgi:hypothetical protein
MRFKTVFVMTTILSYSETESLNSVINCCTIVTIVVVSRDKVRIYIQKYFMRSTYDTDREVNSAMYHSETKFTTGHTVAFLRY